MGWIAIFTDDPGWHGAELKRALAQRGFEARFVSLTEGRFALGPDAPGLRLADWPDLPLAAFVRGVPGGSLEQVVLCLDVLHALEALSIPVYNAGRGIERSVDKALTSVLLQRCGLNVPPTWVTRSTEQALTIAEAELARGHDLVSKPLFGSQGEGVRRLDKPSDLVWLNASGGIYYLQRFIPSLGEGYADIRVFVIAGRAVAAMRRQGRSFLNNLAQGGLGVAIPLERTLAEYAVAATRALALDYAGVDLIQDKQGCYWLIEVNGIPAWKGVQSACQLPITEFLVDDFIDRKLKLNEAAA